MTISEANLQSQWAAWIDLIETGRVYLDDTMLTLLAAIDTELANGGDYTVRGLTAASADYRASAATLISPARVIEALEPILFEYNKLITDDATAGDGFGGYRDLAQIMRALYEHFVNNSLTVESRNITYDTATPGGANVGNGTIRRLTVDENGFDLEACTAPEKKRWRCRSDASTGVQQEAEVFEVLGATQAPDDLNREGFGSGISIRTFLTSKHAGGGGGGSLLRNGSFSTFTDHATTPTLNGWVINSGGATFDAETTIVYRDAPGITTSQSLKQTAAFEIEQLASSFRNTQLDQDTPYFYRVMVYKVSGATGNITLTWGSKSQVFTLGAMTNDAWNECVIDFDADCWFRSFNKKDLSVKITGDTISGTFYLDDAILAEWDQVDGTYWITCPNAAVHVPWQVDDYFEFDDSGGLPETAKIQYYLWLTGLGYLPSTTGTPTFTEPT